MRALQNANITATADTPSETNAASGVGTAATSTAPPIPNQRAPETGGGQASGGQQSIGLVSPPVPVNPATGPPLGSSGLTAAEQGKLSIEKSRKKNRDQQAALSNKALV
jgi:hypothetical protein